MSEFITQLNTGFKDTNGRTYELVVGSSPESKHSLDNSITVFVDPDTAGTIAVVNREKPGNKTFVLAECEDAERFLHAISLPAKQREVLTSNPSLLDSDDSLGGDVYVISKMSEIQLASELIILERDEDGAFVGGRKCSMKPSVGNVMMTMGNEGVVVGSKVESVTSDEVTVGLARNRIAYVLV